MVSGQRTRGSRRAELRHTAGTGDDAYRQMPTIGPMFVTVGVVGSAIAYATSPPCHLPPSDGLFRLGRSRGLDEHREAPVAGQGAGFARSTMLVMNAVFASV